MMNHLLQNDDSFSNDRREHGSTQTSVNIKNKRFTKRALTKRNKMVMEILSTVLLVNLAFRWGNLPQRTEQVNNCFIRIVQHNEK